MAFNQNSPGIVPVVKAVVLTLLTYCCFYTQLAYAATVPDVGTMLENFSQEVPQFMQLVTAVAYVLGMWFIYKGVLGLKQFGEQRSMMTSNPELKSAVVFMLTGTCLLYLPSSVQSGLTTFWTQPNPYGYVSETTDQWTTMYQDMFLIIQFIGTIAFIRGLIVLSHLGGHHGGQQNQFGRGLTFIIAGVLCINLYDFLTAINNTLGVTGVVTGSS